MKKAPQNRDAIKEFLQSLGPQHYCLQPISVKCGLPARTRPGLSERTRAGNARRIFSNHEMH